MAGMAGIVAASTLAGLLVGSFLTALTARLGTSQSILRGRSRCDSCARTLGWFELLPVLSFILQGGQCRSCRAPIPRTYPAMEVITAVLFAAIAWAAFSGVIALPPFLGGETPTGPGRAVLVFLYYAFFAGIGVAVSFYDFERQMIPMALIVPLIGVGVLSQITGAVRVGTLASLLPPAALAIGAFASFWSLWFFSGGRAMGRGDADVAFAIASVLAPAVSVVAFLFAFWLGAVVGAFLVIAGRAGWGSRIPFAPFLFSGAVAAIVIAPYLGPLVSMRYAS